MAEDLVPFNGADEQVVARWLDEAGEVVVQVYYAHSGGGPHNYLVRSIADFRQCVAEGRARRPLPGWRDIICFDVFGGPMFFLRGRADQELLKRARRAIPDGRWFWVIDPAVTWPREIADYVCGNRHFELSSLLDEQAGKEVAIGCHPDDEIGNAVAKTDSPTALRNRRYDVRLNA